MYFDVKSKVLGIYLKIVGLWTRRAEVAHIWNVKRNSVRVNFGKIDTLRFKITGSVRPVLYINPLGQVYIDENLEFSDTARSSD